MQYRRSIASAVIPQKHVSVFPRAGRIGASGTGCRSSREVVAAQNVEQGPRKRFWCSPRRYVAMPPPGSMTSDIRYGFPVPSALPNRLCERHRWFKVVRTGEADRRYRSKPPANKRAGHASPVTHKPHPNQLFSPLLWPNPPCSYRLLRGSRNRSPQVGTGAHSEGQRTANVGGRERISRSVPLGSRRFTRRTGWVSTQAGGSR